MWPVISLLKVTVSPIVYTGGKEVGGRLPASMWSLRRNGGKRPRSYRRQSTYRKSKHSRKMVWLQTKPWITYCDSSPHSHTAWLFSVVMQNSRHAILTALWNSDQRKYSLFRLNTLLKSLEKKTRYTPICHYIGFNILHSIIFYPKLFLLLPFFIITWFLTSNFLGVTAPLLQKSILELNSFFL
jgi:hypothetical protein